jgi:DNA replication protein DnaC
MQEITDFRKLLDERKDDILARTQALDAEDREKELEEINRFKNNLKNNIEKYLVKFGVPKRFLNPRSHTDKLNFEKGYFFHGPVGTGKTDCAASLLKNIVLNTEPGKESGRLTIPSELALFVSVPMMLLNIRSAFKKDSIDENEIIKKYTKVKILVLDDLGTEKVSEWVMQTLYIIINARYEDEKQTIITSNYDLNEIKESLNDKIASRITAMTETIHLTGIDRRSGLSVMTVVK